MIVPLYLFEQKTHINGFIVPKNDYQIDIQFNSHFTSPFLLFVIGN
jgi:hypothetical protein